MTAWVLPDGDLNNTAIVLPPTTPSAGGGTITTQDEGVVLSATVNTLNFTGTAIQASGGGATTRVEVGIQQHTYAYAATVTIDATLYDLIDITLTGPLTLNVTGGIDGKHTLMRLRQDGTGSRVVTLGTMFRYSADLPSFTASTGANKLDWLVARYTSADLKYDLLAYNRGF